MLSGLKGLLAKHADASLKKKERRRLAAASSWGQTTATATVHGDGNNKPRFLDMLHSHHSHRTTTVLGSGEGESKNNTSAVRQDATGMAALQHILATHSVQPSNGTHRRYLFHGHHRHHRHHKHHAHRATPQLAANC